MNIFSILIISLCCGLFVTFGGFFLAFHVQTANITKQVKCMLVKQAFKVAFNKRLQYQIIIATTDYLNMAWRNQLRHMSLYSNGYLQEKYDLSEQECSNLNNIVNQFLADPKTVYVSESLVQQVVKADHSFRFFTLLWNYGQLPQQYPDEQELIKALNYLPDVTLHVQDYVSPDIFYFGLYTMKAKPANQLDANKIIYLSNYRN